MQRKFCWSFILVGVILALLKVSVDLCLPFRESAFLPQMVDHDQRICKVLYSWDNGARYARIRLSQQDITMTTEIEKKALDPMQVSFGDVAVGWEVPRILPLILETFPRYPVAILKLFIFWSGFALIVAGFWHYLGVLFQIYQVTSREMSMNLDHDNRFEKLLGRDRQ